MMIASTVRGGSVACASISSGGSDPVATGASGMRLASSRTAARNDASAGLGEDDGIADIASTLTSVHGSDKQVRVRLGPRESRGAS